MAPCAVCSGTSFTYLCLAVGKEITIKMHQEFLTGEGVFVDTKQHIAHLLDGIHKIQINKYCNKRHYNASIENIIPYQFDGEDRIAVPDSITYEDFCIKIENCYDSTTNKETGSLIFTNHYDTNETHIFTTNGWHIISLIPLDRLDFTNMPETISKIERCMMLA
jgi:hypothetical protein